MMQRLSVTFSPWMRPFPVVIPEEEAGSALLGLTVEASNCGGAADCPSVGRGRRSAAPQIAPAHRRVGSLRDTVEVIRYSPGWSRLLVQETSLRGDCLRLEWLHFALDGAAGFAADSGEVVRGLEVEPGISRCAVCAGGEESSGPVDCATGMTFEHHRPQNAGILRYAQNDRGFGRNGGDGAGDDCGDLDRSEER